jgi:predicted lipoprotein with Yx(FWY)xxD motif
MRRPHIVVMLVVATVALAAGGADATGAGAGKLSLAVAKRTVAGKSKTIVVDGRGVAVYELGGESLAHLQCTMRACLAQWPALEVPSATTHVTVATGVPGTVSIMHRLKGGFYQLMLDRHPLYYDSGDQSHGGSVKGQGIAGPGGTWHVVTTAG